MEQPKRILNEPDQGNFDFLGYARRWQAENNIPSGSKLTPQQVKQRSAALEKKRRNMLTSSMAAQGVEKFVTGTALQLADAGQAAFGVGGELFSAVLGEGPDSHLSGSYLGNLLAASISAGRMVARLAIWESTFGNVADLGRYAIAAGVSAYAAAEDVHKRRGVELSADAARDLFATAFAGFAWEAGNITKHGDVRAIEIMNESDSRARGGDGDFMDIVTAIGKSGMDLLGTGGFIPNSDIVGQRAMPLGALGGTSSFAKDLRSTGSLRKAAAPRVAQGIRSPGGVPLHKIPGLGLVLEGASDRIGSWIHGPVASKDAATGSGGSPVAEAAQATNHIVDAMDGDARTPGRSEIERGSMEDYNRRSREAGKHPGVEMDTIDSREARAVLGDRGFDTFGGHDSLAGVMLQDAFRASMKADGDSNKALHQFMVNSEALHMAASGLMKKSGPSGPEANHLGVPHLGLSRQAAYDMAAKSMDEANGKLYGISEGDVVKSLEQKRDDYNQAAAALGQAKKAPNIFQVAADELKRAENAKKFRAGQEAYRSRSEAERSLAEAAKEPNIFDEVKRQESAKKFRAGQAAYQERRAASKALRAAAKAPPTPFQSELATVMPSRSPADPALRPARRATPSQPVVARTVPFDSVRAVIRAAVNRVSSGGSRAVLRDLAARRNPKSAGAAANPGPIRDFDGNLLSPEDLEARHPYTPNNYQPKPEPDIAYDAAGNRVRPGSANAGFPFSTMGEDIPGRNVGINLQENFNATNTRAQRAAVPATPRASVPYVDTGPPQGFRRLNPGYPDVTTITRGMGPRDTESVAGILNDARSPETDAADRNLSTLIDASAYTASERGNYDPIPRWPGKLDESTGVRGPSPEANMSEGEVYMRRRSAERRQDASHEAVYGDVDGLSPSPTTGKMHDQPGRGTTLHGLLPNIRASTERALALVSPEISRPFINDWRNGALGNPREVQEKIDTLTVRHGYSLEPGPRLGEEVMNLRGDLRSLARAEGNSSRPHTSAGRLNQLTGEGYSRISAGETPEGEARGTNDPVPLEANTPATQRQDGIFSTKARPREFGEVTGNRIVDTMKAVGEAFSSVADTFEHIGIMNEFLAAKRMQGLEHGVGRDVLEKIDLLRYGPNGTVLGKIMGKARTDLAIPDAKMQQFQNYSHQAYDPGLPLEAQKGFWDKEGSTLMLKEFLAAPQVPDQFKDAYMGRGEYGPGGGLPLVWEFPKPDGTTASFKGLKGLNEMMYIAWNGKEPDFSQAGARAFYFPKMDKALNVVREIVMENGEYHKQTYNRAGKLGFMHHMQGPGEGLNYYQALPIYLNQGLYGDRVGGSFRMFKEIKEILGKKYPKFFSENEASTNKMRAAKIYIEAQLGESDRSFDTGAPEMTNLVAYSRELNAWPTRAEGEAMVETVKLQKKLYSDSSRKLGELVDKIWEVDKTGGVQLDKLTKDGDTVMQTVEDPSGLLKVIPVKETRKLGKLIAAYNSSKGTKDVLIDDPAAYAIFTDGTKGFPVSFLAKQLEGLLKENKQYAKDLVAVVERTKKIKGTYEMLGGHPMKTAAKYGFMNFIAAKLGAKFIGQAGMSAYDAAQGSSIFMTPGTALEVAKGYPKEFVKELSKVFKDTMMGALGQSRDGTIETLVRDAMGWQAKDNEFFTSVADAVIEPLKHNASYAVDIHDPTTGDGRATNLYQEMSARGLDGMVAGYTAGDRAMTTVFANGLDMSFQKEWFRRRAAGESYDGIASTVSEAVKSMAPGLAKQIDELAATDPSAARDTLVHWTVGKAVIASGDEWNPVAFLGLKRYSTSGVGDMAVKGALKFTRHPAQRFHTFMSDPRAAMLYMKTGLMLVVASALMDGSEDNEAAVAAIGWLTGPDYIRDLLSAGEPTMKGSALETLSAVALGPLDIGKNIAMDISKDRTPRVLHPLNFSNDRRRRQNDTLVGQAVRKLP